MVRNSTASASGKRSNPPATGNKKGRECEQTRGLQYSHWYSNRLSCVNPDDASPTGTAESVKINFNYPRPRVVSQSVVVNKPLISRRWPFISLAGRRCEREQKRKGKKKEEKREREKTRNREVGKPAAFENRVARVYRSGPTPPWIVNQARLDRGTHTRARNGVTRSSSEISNRLPVGRWII